MLEPPAPFRMPWELMMSTDDLPTPPAPAVSSTQTFVRCLAMLSAGAAVIHFAVAQMHYQEYWAFGAFMIATGILQLAWVGAALSGAGRWLWAAGAVMNSGIVAVYIVTRTVGDIVGPTPHEVEPVGFGDAFCTVLEGLLVIGCLTLLLQRSVRVIRPKPAGWLVGATGVVMATLLVVALLDGGPEMSMSAGDAAPAAAAVTPASATMNGMSMAAAPKAKSAALHLKSSSPAGDITMPRPSMQMPAGMRMASGPCTARPTLAQQAATVSLVNSSWKHAQRFRSLVAAKAAGFVPITPVGRPVVHYINIKYYQASLSGGPVINPARPQSLVYANTPKGAVLVSTMYITSPGTTNPPQPGGCLTQWHLHINLCFGSFGTVVGLAHDGSCPTGTVNRVTPPMLHVWYVPIPGGPTAVDAPDAQVVHAAERVRSPHNPTA
jgi:hypothetical protein